MGIEEIERLSLAIFGKKQTLVEKNVLQAMNAIPIRERTAILKAICQNKTYKATIDEMREEKLCEAKTSTSARTYSDKGLRKLRWGKYNAMLLGTYKEIPVEVVIRDLSNYRINMWKLHHYLCELTELLKNKKFDIIPVEGGQIK